jgi:phosphatidylserine/phosphatidylglycerophosphate/cardiolipin synthase-like enzyme
MDQRPSEGHFDINTAVLIAIRSATETIDIEAGYFNPIDWMADALFDAVARGVRVRVLVNSYRAVDWASSAESVGEYGLG